MGGVNVVHNPTLPGLINTGIVPGCIINGLQGAAVTNNQGMAYRLHNSLIANSSILATGQTSEEEDLPVSPIVGLPMYVTIKEVNNVICSYTFNNIDTISNPIVIASGGVFSLEGTAPSKIYISYDSHPQLCPFLDAPLADLPSRIKIFKSSAPTIAILSINIKSITKITSGEYYVLECDSHNIDLNAANNQSMIVSFYKPLEYEIDEMRVAPNIVFNATNGDIHANAIYAAELYTFSDESLKHDINSLSFDRCKDIISQFNPVSFNLNTNNQLLYGLIAQEVEKIDPSLVTKDQATDKKLVNYNSIIALLIKTVQELLLRH